MNMDGVKIDMVSADQMSEEDRAAVFNQEMCVDAIPDLDILTGHIFDILSYLEKSNTKKMLKTNEAAIKMYLNNKYADTVPYGMITLLMEEEGKEANISRMLRMFEDLRNAKAGKLSLEEAEKILTDDVNEEYLYAKYGSKEAFEAALAKEVRNEQRKKKGDIDLSDIGKISVKH
jgi:hypothetical protein